MAEPHVMRFSDLMLLKLCKCSRVHDGARSENTPFSGYSQPINYCAIVDTIAQYSRTTTLLSYVGHSHCFNSFKAKHMFRRRKAMPRELNPKNTEEGNKKYKYDKAMIKPE